MSRVLLVAGGNPSDWPTIEPATYDYFVGIDRGCLHLLEADLPLQLAVGDFDSLSREEYHFVQETAETLIQAPAEKDDTDTQLALQEALQRFPQAEMTIIGATGGRIDHLLAIFGYPLNHDFKAYFVKSVYAIVKIASSITPLVRISYQKSQIKNIWPTAV